MPISNQTYPKGLEYMYLITRILSLQEDLKVLNLVFIWEQFKLSKYKHESQTPKHLKSIHDDPKKLKSQRSLATPSIRALIVEDRRLRPRKWCGKLWQSKPRDSWYQSRLHSTERTSYVLWTVFAENITWIHSQQMLSGENM